MSSWQPWQLASLLEHLSAHHLCVYLNRETQFLSPCLGRPVYFPNLTPPGAVGTPDVGLVLSYTPTPSLQNAPERTEQHPVSPRLSSGTLHCSEQPKEQ